MAARSKAWVFDRSFGGIMGSNPAGARMYVVCVCYQVRSLHPADDPSTGVPPNVVCLNVIVEPRQ